MWDVVALVLQSKGLWKTLLALLAIVSALSYFGVLTFSYNDGLKVVFGPDPEKARKREEERVLKAALDRAEAHRATLYAHALGTWRGSLKQDGSERVSQQTRCTWSTSMSYDLNIGPIDKTIGKALGSMHVNGFRKAVFEFNGTNEGVVNQRRRSCFEKASVSEAGTDSYDLRYDVVLNADGVRELLIGNFVETRCSGGCMSFSEDVTMALPGVLILDDEKIFGLGSRLIRLDSAGR